MGLAAEVRIPYEDYLQIERETGIKHEYLEGRIAAMAGGSADHALIALNLGSLLRVALRGGPCRPFPSDWKIWMGEAQRAAYPDLSVICGPIVRPAHDPNSATNPTLVAEVLSPGTEDLDRGSKARDYRSLPTLQVLLFIDSRRVRVESLTRNPDDTWTLRDHGPGGKIELPSLDTSLEVDALYEDVEFDKAPPAREGEAGIGV